MTSLNLIFVLHMIQIIHSTDPTKITNSGLICGEKLHDCASDYFGEVPQDECENRDCCFERVENNIGNIPWCFYGTPPTTIPIIYTTTLTPIPTTIPLQISTTIPDVPCDEKCSQCSQESNSYDLCISCNKDLGYVNVNYTIYPYPKSKYLHCHKSTDSLLQNFYYNSDLDQYRPCYKTCKTCSKEGDYLLHNCDTCKSGYRLKPFGEEKNNCVTNCTYYSRNAYEQYKCLSSFPCPEEAPYMIEDKKACVFSCEKDDEYQLLYNGKCVKTCPTGTYLVGNGCKVNENAAKVEINTFYSNGNVTDEVGNLVETYSKEFNYTSNYVSMYKNNHYSVAIYKNVSVISELSLDVPLINFQNCYNKIQSIYNITQDLIIAIVDRLDQNNPNTSYSIYHPVSGEKLDAAAICKDETISIVETLSIDKDDPEYELKMSLIGQNINIYNSEDSFFNDICFYFNNSKKRDIALSDRIKYLHQDTNLCDSGCKQVNFDLATQQAQCDCKYNDIETEEKNNELIKDNEILDAVAGELLEFINTSNIFIVKCYKYIFKYIDDSIGAIISLILLCLNIGFTLLFFLYELNKVKLYVYSLTEGYINYLGMQKREPPRRKSHKIITNNANNEFKNKMIDKETNSFKNDNSNVIIYDGKQKKIKSGSMKINNKLKGNFKDSLDIPSDNKINYEKKLKKVEEKYQNHNEKDAKFIEEYLSTSLDDLEYDDAIVKDKRSFCEYFCEQFIEKQNIAYTFFASDPITPRSIKIILFIFNLILNFVINALFITEEYISILYHLDEKDSFFSFFTRSIERFIKTTIVGEVIDYIISFFFIEESKIKGFFKREKDDINALKQNMIQFIKELKNRYLSFIILVFFIIIISFFYLLCFNYAYPYTQIEWIKTSVTVIVIRQLLSCLIIFLEVVFRFLSFKIQSEKLYKFSRVLN